MIRVRAFSVSYGRSIEKGIEVLKQIVVFHSATTFVGRLDTLAKVRRFILNTRTKLRCQSIPPPGA